MGRAVSAVSEILPTSPVSPRPEQPGDENVYFLFRGVRTHYFSWDWPTRSGAGNVAKGFTQGPSFELETSIMACHSSSTTAGQVAGLADSILPQSKGFQASHF